MAINRIIATAFTVSSLLTLSACSLFGTSSDEPPPLGVSYDMVDSNGTVVGKVTFTPLGQGQVYDAKGNLIGSIIKGMQ